MTSPGSSSKNTSHGASWNTWGLHWSALTTRLGWRGAEVLAPAADPPPQKRQRSEESTDCAHGAAEGLEDCVAGNAIAVNASAAGCNADLPPRKERRVEEKEVKGDLDSSNETGTYGSTTREDSAGLSGQRVDASDGVRSAAVTEGTDASVQKVSEQVRDFLHASGLDQYTQSFIEYGYDDMEVVCDMDKDDLSNEYIRMVPGHILKFKKAVRRYLAQGQEAPVAAVAEMSQLSSHAVPTGTVVVAAARATAKKRLEQKKGSELCAKAATQTSIPDTPDRDGKKRAECASDCRMEIAGCGVETPVGQAASANKSRMQSDRKRRKKESGSASDPPERDPVKDVMNMSKSLQDAQLKLNQLDGKDVAVIVGDTGTGKTTGFLFLAGCDFLPESHGEGFSIEEIPESLASSRVSNEGKSVTDTIACWAASPTCVLIDTPGHHDTRSTTSDVTMSILIKEIARRCRSLRFICFFNMQCLRNHRGETSRDALDTLSRWVPDLVQHRQAISFVFTAATDPSRNKWSVEELEKWTESLPKSIEIVKEGSDNGLQPMWEWIEEDLLEEQPQFTHVFVPHLANRAQMIQLLLPNQSASVESEGLQPSFMNHPRDIVKSGLSKLKEHALRSSIESLVDATEASLSNGASDYAEVEQMMGALQCLAHHVGKDFKFVAKAWAGAQGLVKRAIEKATSELKARIESGTSTTMPEAGGSFVQDTATHIERLYALASLGDEPEHEDIIAFLDLRLEMVQHDFIHRVQGSEGQQGVAGVSKHPHCLLAWQPLSKKAERLYMLCLKHVQENLSIRRIKDLRSASIGQQWRMVAVLRSLRRELEECPVAFHPIASDAGQAMQFLWAQADTVVKTAAQDANDQLHLLRIQPGSEKRELLEAAQLTQAIKVLTDSVQVVKEEMLEKDDAGDIDDMLSSVIRGLREGMQAAAHRVEMILNTYEHPGAAIVDNSSLAGALRIDILNIRSVAACRTCAPDDNFSATISKKVTSRAFAVLRGILDAVQQAVGQCEATQQLHEAEADTLSKRLQDAAAMGWLLEVDADLGIELRKQAEMAELKLMDFFKGRVSCIDCMLRGLQAHPTAFPSKEDIAALASSLRSVKIITCFSLSAAEALQSKCKQMVAEHLEGITADGSGEKLVNMDLQQLPTIDAGKAEQLLALRSLDWGFLQVDLPFTQSQVDQSLDALGQEMRDFFTKSGHYNQKRRIIDSIMPWPSCRLTSKFPSCDELHEQLMEDVDSTFQQGVDACEPDGCSPDWEDIVAVCNANIKEVSLAFQECGSSEVICKHASSRQAELERKSKLKRSDLDASIKEAIDSFEFGRLKSYLEKPPSGGDTYSSYMQVVNQVRDCINNRYDIALQSVHDAADSAPRIKAIERAHQEIGSFLRAQHNIDLMQKVDGAIGAMHSHFQGLLRDLDKDLGADVVDMDFGAILQKLSAAQSYWDIMQQNGLGEQGQNLHEELLASWEAWARKKREVVDMMEASFNSIKAGEPAKTRQLADIMRKAQEQPINSEGRTLYEQWVEQLGMQLLELQRHVDDVLATDVGDAGWCVNACKALVQEWGEWLADHMRLFRWIEDLHLSDSMVMAEKQHEKQLDRVRESLSCEARIEELLREMDQLSTKTSLRMVGKGPSGRGQAHSSYLNLQKMVSDHLRVLVQTTFRDLLQSGEVCLAGETLDVILMVAQKFRTHLSEEVLVLADDCVAFVQACSVSLCKDMEQEISGGCASGRAVRLQQDLIDHVRYLWPAARFDTLPQDLAKACTSMHQAVTRWIEKDKQTMDGRHASEHLAALRENLHQSRWFAQSMVGGFAVYAEIAERMATGHGQHTSLREARSSLQQAFAREQGMLELARCFALLELSPGTTSVEDIKSKQASMALKHDPNKGATPRVKERKALVMKQINAASMTLQTAPDCKRYYHHLQELHSEKVHEIFEKQLEEVKDCLQKRMYKEAKDVLQELPKWRTLDHFVRPPLDVDKMKTAMGDIVASHALHMCADARSHLESFRYKSLQHSLAALVRLEATFGASHEDIYRKLTEAIHQLHSNIRKRIRESVDHARGCLERKQMHGFADDLVYLGLIWWELTDFKAAAQQQICKLLSCCLSRHQKLGKGYLVSLGMHLAKVQDDAGYKEAGHDGTVSSAAVAHKIIHDFPQFTIVSNMFWNSAVEKMQKDSKACIEEMTAKQLIEDIPVALDQHDLTEGLKKYSASFDRMLKGFIAGQLSLDDVINRCLQKLEAMKQDNDGLAGLEVTAKAEIPELLSYVFMHYTIASSGEIYRDHILEAANEGDEEAPPLEQGLKTPHNIQVLAVLRFFGFGSNQVGQAELDNHLVQVRTGEGKSLILGSTATIFALLGFHVRCVCYSALLSSRDEKSFERTFADFGVASLVKYSQITTYSEDAVAAQGDIRSLTSRLLGADQVAPEREKAGALPREHSGEVLLIDEVDVLWGPEFYGKTHNQMLSIPHQSARQILQKLWDWRLCNSTTQQLQEWAKASPEYSKILSDFPGFEYVIESQVKMMCSDLREFQQRAPPHPEFNDANGGRIGYKHLDDIEFDVVHGYKTAFAYLEHQASFQPDGKEKKFDAALSLLVDCGHFSYNNIAPKYIFGVSGTVQQLEGYQRGDIAKHNLSTYTIMPSVFGESKFRFLNQQRSDPIKICEAKDFHHELAMDIQEKIQDEDRAVTVFFNDRQSLESFTKSDYCKKFPGYHTLEEQMSHSDKQHSISKAATRGQITFATAVFGRGSDFECHDEKLQKKGGLDVLQTFVSLDISEEVQIQGRTARQGKAGTYSLLLKSEEIEEELGLQPSVLKSQSPDVKYKMIREACKPKQSSKFDGMKKELEEATEMDKLTRAYFADVLANDAVAAKASFKEMYMRCIRKTLSGHQHSFHYIICLDESGSMGCNVGRTGKTKLQFASEAVLEFVEKAKEQNAGTSSAVSLVMFNDTARVACKELLLHNASRLGDSITANGGSTSFGPPLQDAVDLMRSTLNKYQRHCVLFYTDGKATYPAAEVQSFSSLMQEYPDQIDFFAVAEDSAETLVQVCAHLYTQDDVMQHCLGQVQPEQIGDKMIETLNCMSGYVRHS